MRYWLIILIISGISFSIKAQDISQERQDKIEALKIAFITNRLELTPKEAQIFWPVYNEYNDKLEKMRKERKEQYRDSQESLDNLTDKEVEALIDNEMLYRQKEVDLAKEYHGQLKKVIPVKKVARLYLAEEAFKRHLLKKLQESRAVNK